jgi:hypothetical protein
MPFTEFCCRSGGSNLNAGTLLGDSTEPGTSALFSYTGTFATNTFTVSSGNPSTDGVTAGMFVHVNNGSALGRIARITSVTSTTIVLSATASVGSGTGATVANVGGAFQGPNGTSAFPLGTLSTSLTNAAGNVPRINLKNDAAFSVTAGVTSNATGPFTVQGYNTSYGDGGKALLQGPSTGGAITTLTIAASTSQTVCDLCVTGTGATGAGDAVSVTGQYTILRGVVAYGARGRGFVVGSLSGTFIECEAYGNCLSNTAGHAGFHQTNGPGNTFIRCIAHDNSGSNSSGFKIDSSTTILCCIADSNGSHGFNIASSSVSLIICNSDAYNNSGSGFTLTARNFVVENCNSVKNTGWGFLATGVTIGTFHHCGVGSGTQANGSGTYSLNASLDSVVNGVTYASDVTPWADPANGDFRISLAAARGVGRGSFTQTASSYAGTVGYPDIGAAQHQDSGGGSTVIVIED